MWLAEVKAKAKSHNQILFSKDSLLLENLRQMIDHANRRALILWALELAEETAVQLEAKYPNRRPKEAMPPPAWRDQMPEEMRRPMMLLVKAGKL